MRLQAAEAVPRHAGERAALERQAHITLVGSALVNAFTTRHEPRILYRLAEHGVFPLTRYCEVSCAKHFSAGLTVDQAFAYV